MPLFFNCLTIFHWILPKNDDRFGLANPKLRKNILFCMSSTLLEAFLKFGMSKQWQWHMKNTIEITFLNCLIRFHSLLLENNAGSNWPYQNWAKSLSDSWIMKNTMESTVLQLFDILSMNICLKMVDLNLPYQIKKNTCLASIHWTLPKNVNVFGLSILEWRETPYFYMSNTFLEAFLFFQTGWQLQWYYGKCYRNHCFSIV